MLHLRVIPQKTSHCAILRGYMTKNTGTSLGCQHEVSQQISQISKYKIVRCCHMQNQSCLDDCDPCLLPPHRHCSF